MANTKEEKAAYMREYLRQNPDKALAQARRKRERRESDPLYAEKDRLRSFEYAQRNAESNRARAAAWQKANPERYKENMRRSHQKNKHERVVKAAMWKAAHPEKRKASAIDYTHRRRARMAGGDIEGCSALIARWKGQIRFSCLLCGGRFLTKGFMHVDHIRPLAKGGAHVPENLQRLCKGCNLSKSDNYTA